jgi:hypothetical protein
MNFNNAIKSAKAGDLIWMLAGTYTGKFNLFKRGKETEPIVFRAFPGKHVIVNGGIAVKGAYTWVWGLEIMDPKGVAETGGILLLAQGGHAINNVIHDQLGETGISAWSHPGQIIYGNIVYTQIPESNNPHNLYTQNDFTKNGYKYVVNNMLLDAESATPETFNFHAYTEKGVVSGFHVENNIVANGRFLIGGYNKPADNEVVIDNYFYNSSVQFGYKRPAQARFQNNYLARSKLYVESFWGAGETLYSQTAPNIFTGNVILFPTGRHILFRTSAYLPSGKCDGCARIRTTDIFDNNSYSDPFSANFEAAGVNQTDVKFPDWKRLTAAAGKAFDTNSTLVNGATGEKIVILPNDYEPTRVHLAIYNWNHRPSVRVDLSTVLTSGRSYQIFPAKATFGPPLVSGNYNGPINIPTNKKEFGVYLLVRK